MTPTPRPAVRRRRRAAGYTLVELFVTVAVLMMVLGLAVNLAGRQRDDSLKRRARGQLQRLAAAVARYAAAHGGRLPAVAPLVDPAADPTAAVGDGAETAVGAAAVRNRDDLRLALGWPPPADPAADPLTDPWGRPIAFLPRQSPLIGMAPADRPFFVSGGPDRQFLTRADNLYSYDDAHEEPPDVPETPATAPAAAPAVAPPGPAGGGHGE